MSMQVALAEAVHRARNDLAAVAAMLRLQAGAAGSLPVRLALLDAEAWVLALSSLNGRLDGLKETFVESAALLNGMAEDFQTMRLGRRSVNFTVNAESHQLPLLRAKALGLIVNELVVNALKYAFPDGRSGTVSIGLRRSDDHWRLSVRDARCWPRARRTSGGHRPWTTNRTIPGSPDRWQPRDRAAPGRWDRVRRLLGADL
jgi:two-component sensor histidine kinase